MSQRNTKQRLEKIKAELLTTFGMTVKWQLLCQEQGATTTAQQIRLAEQVLAEPSSGSVVESQANLARLRGATTRTSTRPYKPTGF